MDEHSPENQQELEERITVAFEIVNKCPNMVRGAVRSVIHRARVCYEENGRQFEQLL